ncbi:MAG: glycosyltransferase [Bacteroidota bacterium]|nr:glycosyltransferase [Bacteroidota bacterium]
MKLSLIIPVFNRPQEIDELLQSLTTQSAKNFEVVIVEDGSTEKCDHIISKYSGELDIKYFFKNNSGPGQSRNYGAERAVGEYFIFFDSDVIVPETYIEIVNAELNSDYVDAFGGPDAAHPSFSPIQKAINYSMTSFFTTGGIRGAKNSMEKFHPRSFNMGISRKVFDVTKGFSTMRFGEDIDFSLRIMKEGFSTRLFNNAFVYHKRRNNFRTFYKQVNNSGVARINLFRRHPQSLKPVHLLPAIFVLGEVFLILMSIFFTTWFLLPLGVLAISMFADSSIKNKSIKVGLLSVVTSFEQLTAYGLGFLKATWKRIIMGKDEFHNFKKNFYK